MNILITLGSQTVIVSLTTRHTFFIHICLVIVVIVYKHEESKNEFYSTVSFSSKSAEDEELTLLKRDQAKISSVYFRL